MQAVDLFTTYQFIKRLVQPFERWDAFKYGVIDKDGNVLIPREQLKGAAKDSWGYFDILCANLKKLLAKLPGGKSSIASYAAAFMLLKEGQDVNEDNYELFLEVAEIMLPQYIAMYEEGSVPTNATGAAVSPTGPGEEPPVDNRRKKIVDTVIRRNKK
jgi:hypothetical protein